MHRDQEESTIELTLVDQSKAIRLCLNHQLTVPALSLIYSSVDFCASLIRPANQTDVKGIDFISWIDRYMKPDTTLGVTAIDLYAARCGILHTSSANSRLWKDKKANRIFYTWGDQKADTANDVLTSLGKPERFLHVEKLFETLVDGMNKFVSNLQCDNELRLLAAARASSTLTNVTELFPK